MESEPITLQQETKIPYSGTCWIPVFSGWSVQTLQAEYRRLSSLGGNETFDQVDKTCMSYILSIRGENTTDQNILNNLKALNASQINCIERAILQIGRAHV